MNLPINPFSDEYFHSELNQYNLEQPYEKDGLTVHMDDQGSPVQMFDNKIWMALRRKNIQSLYRPICKAIGVVGTGGLGLGYFPLRVAAKDEVQQVEIYETDSRVIDFFLDTFANRPEIKKIKVINGDFKNIVPGNYDFIFLDIYTNPIAKIKEVLKDMSFLNRRVKPKNIQVWLEELIIRIGVERDMDIAIDSDLQHFLNCWEQTPLSTRKTLDDLYESARKQLSNRQIKQYLSIKSGKQTLSLPWFWG